MAKSGEFDYLFKLVLIGDAFVGKTSLLQRFADENYDDNYVSTVGVDFRFRTVQVDNKYVKLQIWDTAGQERFRTITSAYYRGAHGVILTYDITNRESFSHVQDWLDEVHKCTEGTAVTKLVIGNKCDLEDERTVHNDEAIAYASSVQAEFIETSAKDGRNVESAFLKIAKMLVDKQPTPNANKDGGGLKTATVQRENRCCGNCC